MSIDHIFIFTDDEGKVADELVEFGLTEGSSRIHVGQGTTNRKFYFDNFFLEILWVHNESELMSESIKQTGLWQRADFKKNNSSPFGLCLVNSEEVEPIFKNSFKYQPDYFPQGQVISILKQETQPTLPWTFLLPFKGQKKNETEPTKHANGINLLTKATFEYPTDNEIKFHGCFKNEKQIAFLKSSRTWLNLLFDNGKQNQKKEFEKLKLTIQY